jgi:hypothetical protein
MKDMEIIESMAWVALGFIPTLLALEFISKKSPKKLAVHGIRRRALVGVVV